MEFLFYVQLFAFTAGSLLYLFLLVLLAGLRRPRLFESLLFFTGIALFLIHVGGLLGLNAEIYYASPPRITMQFAVALLAIGLGLLPGLLVHAHCEYLRRQRGAAFSLGMLVPVVLFYLPVAYFGPVVLPLLVERASLSFLLPRDQWGSLYGLWLGGALLLAAVLHVPLAKESAAGPRRTLHRVLVVILGLAGLLAVFTYHGWFAVRLSFELSQQLPTLLILVSLLPGTMLGYFVVRQNLFRAEFQRSLVYSVSGGFLALLYLTLARRLSVWLEPAFPPEATVSILLFILVLFFEPLQRRVGRVLQRTFRREAERLQHLTSEIQQVARAGDLEELVRFAESRIAETLALTGVRITLRDGPSRPAISSGPVQRFALLNGPIEIGVLEAHYFGQVLSGETNAALSFLAEQLPAALDLCRLIQEKLTLERELAERQRLALLGQMAASISHNLKNPLSSMKTLLQVQLENPGLPENIRKDCELVVAEIDRLSEKLSQLLQYAKPPVRPGAGDSAAGGVCVAGVTEQVVGLLRHDAERRKVKLELVVEPAAAPARIRGTEDAVSDVFSNLIVNALEAVGGGGAVQVRLARHKEALLASVADDGPGIPPGARGRIFQPFFTTKPRGSGLGLAIVERRVLELEGAIEWKSPVRDGRGAEFTVTLPVICEKTNDAAGEVAK